MKTIATHRRLWLLFLLAIISLAPLVWGQQEVDPSQTLEVQKAELELRKLELEVAELKHDNRWATALKFAPFLTALAAGLTIAASVWKFTRQNARQRRLDREERERERRKQLDERFADVVENLGQDSPAMRCGAAVSIRSFLNYSEVLNYDERIYFLLVAMLRIEKHPAVLEVLHEAFKRSVRLQAAAFSKANEKLQQNELRHRLRLSHCDLSGANLTWLESESAVLRNALLADADLSFSCLTRLDAESAGFERARVVEANLQKARLNQARLIDANFRASDLRWVHFKGADLTCCKLQRALLQSAHLENAILEGCRFESADVNSAFFIGASFDQTSKESIVKARNWRKAHFDPELREELDWIESQMRARKQGK